MKKSGTAPDNFIKMPGLLLIPVAFLLLACSAAAPADTVGPTAITPDVQPVKYAYVSNAAEGSVSIIDLAVDQVVGTVKIGDVGAHGIAASPDGRFGYAALESVNEVVVIDGGASRWQRGLPCPTAPA